VLGLINDGHGEKNPPSASELSRRWRDRTVNSRSYFLVGWISLGAAVMPLSGAILFSRIAKIAPDLPKKNIEIQWFKNFLPSEKQTS
jgi:hypothetical protein